MSKLPSIILPLYDRQRAAIDYSITSLAIMDNEVVHHAAEISVYLALDGRNASPWPVSNPRPSQHLFFNVLVCQKLAVQEKLEHQVPKHRFLPSQIRQLHYGSRSSTDLAPLGQAARDQPVVRMIFKDEIVLFSPTEVLEFGVVNRIHLRQVHRCPGRRNVCGDDVGLRGGAA